jgi:hypothetical protein
MAFGPLIVLQKPSAIIPTDHQTGFAKQKIWIPVIEKYRAGNTLFSKLADRVKITPVH